ncbi:MAG: hypothetical protein WCT46_02180 [Candidatus Gracilibacteria bacterium]|jgi:hypothetical protein
MQAISSPGTNTDNPPEDTAPLAGDLDTLTAREIETQLGLKYGPYGIIWNHDEVIIEDPIRQAPPPWSTDELGNYVMMKIKTRPIRIEVAKSDGYTLERLREWPLKCSKIIEQIEAWRTSHPLAQQ